MWRATLIGILIVFFLPAASGAGGRCQETEPVKTLMRLKMDCAHKILEGLVRQDFEALQQVAFRLSLVAGAEDWKAIRTPEYVKHTALFRKAVGTFRQAVRSGNINAAASAYGDLTRSCVHCHEYVLDYKTACDRQK